MWSLRLMRRSLPVKTCVFRILIDFV
jgi:hypothetical protein